MLRRVTPDRQRSDDGFGEGNFKALFESLELDQMRRGVIPAASAEHVAQGTVGVEA